MKILFNEHMCLLKYSRYLNQQPFGILPVCCKTRTQEDREGITGVYIALPFAPTYEGVILCSRIPPMTPCQPICACLAVTSRLGASVDRRTGEKQSCSRWECNCAGLKPFHWGGLAW